MDLLLTVNKVDYHITWPAMLVGHSVFIPTTAHPGEVSRALRPIAKYYDYEFDVQARCEYGRYGARIWRVY